MFSKTINHFKAMLKDESGISAVEYGLLAAGIAVGLYSFIHALGLSLQGIYTDVTTELTDG